MSESDNKDDPPHIRDDSSEEEAPSAGKVVVAVPLRSKALCPQCHMEIRPTETKTIQEVYQDHLSECPKAPGNMTGC